METEERKIVDMRIPLTWLLSAAGVILMTLVTTLWSIAQQTNKLDQLIVSNAKLEKRLDERDIRIDSVRDKNFALERTIEGLVIRVDSLERSRSAGK